MSTLDPRSAIVTALEKVLSEDGYMRSQNAPLPEQVGWNPSCIFLHSDGRKIALEVEEDVNIPTFLVRRIRSSRQHLENTRIMVAAIRNTPLKLSTARIGIENDISIYADPTNPILVLDPSLLAEMTTVPEGTVRTANERFSSNKRIPRVLTQELENLRHLVYAGDLRQFAHDYESVSFSNSEEEHQHVHEFIKERFGNRLKAGTLFEGLNTMSLLEEVSEVVLGKRPHFLHSFQTFLLGAIIIDKNYQLFQELYASGFESGDEIRIDFPWFFASLFHDTASPIEGIETIRLYAGLHEARSRGITSVYSPHLLGCVFESIKAEEMSPEWEPLPTSVPGKLCELLSRHRLDEHGVMGAINLISSSQQMNGRTLVTNIYPAALAIAIHNSLLWPELLDEQLFPVSAKKFPLIFLLLLCDNIEEWGREMQFIEGRERKPNAFINELTFNQNVTKANLWVDEPARAMIIRNRYDWITQRLFDAGDLQTTCTFSTSPVEE